MCGYASRDQAKAAAFCREFRGTGSYGDYAAAIADPNPVMFMMDVSLTGSRGEVPDGHHLVPLGKADVKRSGTDVTIVAMLSAVQPALDAADQLAARGISAEVVDVRSLVPLDIDTIVSSVRKTGHLVIAEQGRRTCGFAAEVTSLATEHAWDALRSAPVRVTWPDVPIPYSPSLELACIVGIDDIVRGVDTALAAGRADAAERHRAGRHRQVAGQAVEEGRLAGSVGADQAEDVALLDRHRRVVDRLEGTEGLDHVARVNQHVSPCGVRAATAGRSAGSGR